MKISAVHNDVTRIEADILVAPLWSGERPPRGLAGRADWYLCGLLSRLIIAGRLRGGLGETTLVAVQGKLLAPRLLLLGLGERGALSPEDRAAHLRRAAAVVADLKLITAAIEMPAIEAREGMQSILEALGDAFAGVIPPGGGELQILAATEEECERWRAAIRGAFPRGQVRAAAARLPRR